MHKNAPIRIVLRNAESVEYYQTNNLLPAS